MGVKLRKYRILNISYPTQTHNMTSSVEKPKHGQQFTPLTKFGERPSADSPKKNFQDDGRTDTDIWMRFMVANTNSRKCTGWYLYKNTAENPKHVMAQLQELYGSLPRITTIVRQQSFRLTGHVMRHDDAANKVLLWKPDGPWRRGRPTTTLLQKHHRERYELQQDKFTNCNEQQKPLEGNHQVTTSSR